MIWSYSAALDRCIRAGRYSSHIEHLVLKALARLQSRAPLCPGFSAEDIAAEIRTQAGKRPPAGHRGAASAPVEPDQIQPAIATLAAGGQVVPAAGGYRLAGTGATLGPDMDGRIADMILLLRQGGAEPMPAGTAADRSGVPAAVLAQVRDAGLILTIGPRIEYPAETVAELSVAVDRLTDADGRIDRTALRAATGLSHRRADALLDWLAARD